MKQRTRRDCHCCRTYGDLGCALDEFLEEDELIRVRHRDGVYLWGTGNGC